MPPVNPPAICTAPRVLALIGALIVACLSGGRILSAKAQDVDRRVLDAEAQRIAVIAKIKPAVVAIFSPNGQGGGSGVLISKDGYALSNFHVVEGAGPVMQCGLPDGNLYDAVLVGLDKVGDVALIKLLPKDPKQEFPVATLGDSEKLKVGDWSLALGNPFLLATDFQPTVTFGLVSGIHRYQYPAGTLLEYTDCIQVDASINPGNSGGPLFNMDGELIGINGRGSFEKRGRVNSGVGYAISINQIKNFLGHLRAGLDTDHATLGATIRSDSEEEASTRLVVDAVLEDSDAYRRGIAPGDEIVSFAGRPMTSTNQYKNVLGLFPKGWRVPLVYRRENEKHEVLVRLMQLRHSEGEEDAKPKPPPNPFHPPPAARATPASKLYQPKPGFANHYFNKLERDRLLAGFRKQGDFTALSGDWTVEAVEPKANRPVTLTIQEVKNTKPAEAKQPATAPRTAVRLTLGKLKYELDPLVAEQTADTLKDPPGSGGLLEALYQYRRLLTLGPAGFEGACYHGGTEPFYPPPADGKMPADVKDLRVDAEVLVTEHAAIPVKWYFAPKDQTLLGFEATVIKGEDPCEVYFGDYREVNGRRLPHRIDVRHGDQSFGNFTVKQYQLAAK